MFTLDAELRSERCDLNDQKNKTRNNRELEDSIANGKKNENTDIDQMAKNCTESKEDAVKTIHEIEEIVRNKKSDIAWLAYHQRKIFRKFRSKKRLFSDMVSKFKVTKSMILFKIALSRLIDDYPKIKDPSLSLHI